MKLSNINPALHLFLFLKNSSYFNTENVLKYLCAFFLMFIFSCPSLIQSQWYLQTNPAGMNAVYDIQFIDSLTGWAAGDNNTILKTINAGENWIIQDPILFETNILFTIYALNSTTVFAAGTNEIIIRSTNGGLNWSVISDTANSGSGIYYDIFFIDQQTGWVGSLSGKIMKTTNGGLSWNVILLNTGSTINQVYFSNTQTGWLAGESGLLKKSTDGGINWSFIPQFTGADFYLNSLHFLNSTTGWLAAYRDIIFKTTDAGNSWDSLAVSAHGQCIRFADSLTGYCGGSDVINNNSVMCITGDGGITWFRQFLPITSGYCSSVWVYNDSIAWAAFGNRIIHTTNAGGPIGIKVSSDIIPSGFRLLQNYPNPFNSSTIIEFEVTKSADYKIEVFNVLGEKISEPVNAKLEYGSHRVIFSSDKLAAGAYYYRLSGDGTSATKKMVIVK